MYYNVISSSIYTNYTGSIAKIQAIGGAPNSYPSQSCLERVEFGIHQDDPASVISNAAASIEGVIRVPLGTIIEGPITALKTSGSGGPAGDDHDSGWLLYLHA